MAEVLPAFLGFASNKLSAFLNEEGRLLGGLRQEVQHISDEFGHIKAFLEKFADSDDHKSDPQLCEWIRQVRDVSYDTEDIIDEFRLLFVSHRQQGFLGSVQRSFKSVKNLPARHLLASKLESVKARIKNISEARRRYELPYANTLPGRPAAVNAWRHSKDDDALLVEEAHLVGIDEPKKHLISHLLDLEVDSQLKVISVLGMGGLGKTTLVRKVYDDAAVESHFQIRFWVPVSQNCDFQNILKGLIQQLLAQFKEPIPQQMDSMNIYQLKELLKEFLRRGRYAIVFDDVWDGYFWDAIKFVLPENSYGGNRVMFTTQIADVASASSVDSHTYVYKMGCLNSRDSWSLLCRKVFKDKQCPKHLMNVAESIVEKCGGLPLAIVAIGGLLASKDSSRKDEWELVQHRLRDEFEGSGKLDRVKRILSLSYNDLPSTLKACLLFTCSIYPQGGIDISIQRLIILLVAERFVEEKEGQTAEKISWDFLKELASRSLITLYEVGVYNGQSGCIRIHDLLREFMASKSREQDMVTIISSTEQLRTPGKVVRRLVFHDNLLEITTPENHHYIDSCRSVINAGEYKSISTAVLTKLLTSKLLTVVDISGINLEEIPEEIFKLYLLRYLGVSGRKIKRVPKSIGRLQNLESLILQETSVKELPMEIQKLHKLRHLCFWKEAAYSPKGHLPWNGLKVPCGMGRLVELQTLYYFDAAETQSKEIRIVKEIGKLAKLRQLRITNLRREDGKELCSSLENLNNLQELIVSVNSSVEKDEVIDLLDLNHPISASSLQSLAQLNLCGRLEKVPAWIRQLQGLEKILLSMSNLVGDDPLETLQHLPNLSQVVLIEDYGGESLCFKAGGFLKLKKLFLSSMRGLKRVRIEKGAMPCIDILSMEELPLVEELPFGIEHLSKLQRLQLLNMSSQLTKKLENAEEESEDCKRISHVPEVVIGYLIDGRWKAQWLSRRRKKETQLQIPVEKILLQIFSILRQWGFSFVILSKWIWLSFRIIVFCVSLWVIFLHRRIRSKI